MLLHTLLLICPYDFQPLEGFSTMLISPRKAQDKELEITQLLHLGKEQRVFMTLRYVCSIARRRNLCAHRIRFRSLAPLISDLVANRPSRLAFGLPMRENEPLHIH